MNTTSENTNYKKRKPSKPVSGLQLAADLGKLPPQVIDAEELVLGTLLEFPRSREEIFNIIKDPSSFYKEGHMIIYGVMRDMFFRHEPISATSVVSVLKKQEKLEFVGGPYYVSKLENRTTSDVGYYCLLIIQEYIKRELIRVSTEIVRSAYEPAIDSLELMEQAIVNTEKLREITNFGVNRPYKITDLHVKSDNPVVLSLQGHPILTRGNISLIIAPPGTGKSQLTEIVLASHLKDDIDTLGFKVHSDKKILLIDTERDKDDAFDGLQRIKRRSGIGTDKTGNFKNLDFWSFRTVVGWREKRMHLRKFIESKEYDLIMLDGYAHFIGNINDVDQSEEFVGELMSYSGVYRCGIMGTLHNNFKQAANSGDARGHLGGAIMREAYTYYALKRDTEDRNTRVLTSKVGNNQKNRGGSDDIDVYFKWSDELSMFVGIDRTGEMVDSSQFPAGNKSSRTNQFEASVEVVMEKLFKEKQYKKLRYKDLFAGFRTYSKPDMSDSSIGRAIARAIKLEIIVCDKDKNYSLKEEETPF